MPRLPSSLGLKVVATALLLAPGIAIAERGGRAADALRDAEQAVERLRAELGRVNAEVTALKRGAHSMRNDYRLRERMADAEALARKLTAAEASLRARHGANTPAGAPIVAPPPVSPQDGSVELEAKADLLADQARKLDGEAERLTKAAAELRSRRVMRRKAGSWDRDPFSGLETSRRSVATVAAVQKAPAGVASSDSSTRGGTKSGGPGATPTLSPGGTNESAGPTTAGDTSPPPSAVLDSSSKGGSRTAASDGTVASKYSPIALSGLADRQAVERRLYLDPATAAEVRQAMGVGGVQLDPEALERGAAALRARARSLQAEARSLRTRSQTP